MAPADDPEAYLNAFERMATAVGWDKVSWVSVLIPCLIGPAQQTVDTVPLAELNDYAKVHKAIMQMFNLNPEAYRQRLREIEFSLDYQLKTIGQKIRVAGLRWL